MRYPFANWIKNLKSRHIGKRRDRLTWAGRTIRKARLGVEHLEDRVVPATYAESLNNGVLSITQTAAGNNNLMWSENNGTYIITDNSTGTSGSFGTPTGNQAGDTLPIQNSIYILNHRSGPQAIADVSSISVILGSGTNVFTLAGTNGYEKIFTSAVRFGIRRGYTSCPTRGPIGGLIAPAPLP
jgi:hypothetical protein